MVLIIAVVVVMFSLNVLFYCFIFLMLYTLAGVSY